MNAWRTIMKNFNQNKITIDSLFTPPSWISYDRLLWKITLPSSSEKKECSKLSYKVRIKHMTTAKKHITLYKP